MGRNLRVEHNVFINALINHLNVYDYYDLPAQVVGNIFGENTRGKVPISYFGVSGGAVESNNCFYTRWPENERRVIGGLTLPEYLAQGKRTDSFVANPQLPGVVGFKQGWPQGVGTDFDAFFTANPELIRRGIGLQPEAFRDFALATTNWEYNVAWATNVLARQQAARALLKAGNDAAALPAFTNLAVLAKGNLRLKSDFLEQAALCANRLKNYDQALALAKSIPLQPLAIRRQMALMVEHKKYAELLAAFPKRTMPSQIFYLNWTCPELEDIISDALYYRSVAFAETKDLDAAEADLTTLVDLENKIGNNHGETVKELVWLRLGDFYHTYLQDDLRALAAYSNVTCRTTLNPYVQVIPKPALIGNSDVLKAATRSAAEIFRRQGKEAEALKIEFSLLKAQAEAFAHAGQKVEALAKFNEALASKGATAEDKQACTKRINELRTAKAS